MPTNNRTIEAILPSQSDSSIITTINHNFQVITERIKELNISLSYLDLLKISTIFTVTDPTAADANLQNFVSTCWNTLANYAGVYIQCSDTTRELFTWMGQYHVHNGDFIVKLPNNQSLYLEGAKPLYMVPKSYDADTKTIVFTPTTATTVASASITLNLSNIPTSGLSFTHTPLGAGATIPSNRLDCRFYINGEEVVFPDYVPGVSFTLPIACNAYLYYRNN